MPILTAGAEFERVHIRPNIYPATLVEVRPHQFPDRDDPSKMKDHMIWAFEIQGKTKSVKVEAITSTAFSAKSNARKFVKALMANQEPPDQIDTDELLGVPCRVRVEDRDKDGTLYSVVKDVFPVESEDEEMPF